MFQMINELLGVEALVLRRAVPPRSTLFPYTTLFRSKARVLNIPIDSHSLRRTFIKFGDYGKVTGLFMCIDVLGLLFGIWSMPYASAVSAVIAVGIEGWSVRENLRAAHSSAAKVTDMVAELAKTQDPKEILNLLRNLDEARAAATAKSSNKEKQ